MMLIHFLVALTISNRRTKLHFTNFNQRYLHIFDKLSNFGKQFSFNNYHKQTIKIIIKANLRFIVTEGL
jgi:hypothetical protein